MTPVERYAHPMGWRNATLFGIGYGGVIAGLPWLIWRAVSLAGVPWRADVILGFVFLIGGSAPLMMEMDERRKVREGWTNLGKPVRIGRGNDDPRS